MLAASADETAAMLATYDAFGREMGQRGVLRGGERLRRPPTRPASGLSRVTSKIPAARHGTVEVRPIWER